MKTSYLALVVLTACLLCIGNAVGQDEKKAESDVSVILLEETLAKAKVGDAEAIFNLGVRYCTGEGMIQDYQEAAKWWRKAADLRNAGECICIAEQT